MREIVPGILTWSWFAERFGYHFNGYLVRPVTDEQLGIAIDPVEMDEATLEAIAAEGVSTIVLSNRNHFRAAERLRLRTGARVLVHPADAGFVRDKGVLVGGALSIGERVGPFTVLSAGGKSPGEVALHWPERRILVVGDVCVGKAPGVLGLLPAAVMDDPAALRQSLRALAEVDFETLLVGDGHCIIGDPGTHTGFSTGAETANSPVGAKAALEALIKTFDPA